MAKQSSFFTSISRLYPHVRPILPRLVMGLLCALLASVMALAIPQVLRVLVNESLTPGGSAEAVWTASLLILVLGIAEAGLVALRRQFVINPATTVETRMRVSLYGHLQDLTVSFHDRWGSGQLLSRAMTDLNFLRRWMAFGAIMLVVTTLTVVIGVAVMFAMSWQLALIFLAAAVPIMIYGFRFRTRFSKVARRSQDQAGDLATTVEESVHGIRVLKAFGRSREALENFNEQAEELRQTEIAKAKHLATFSLVVTLLPELALGAGLVVGILLASTDQLSIGVPGGLLRHRRRGCRAGRVLRHAAGHGPHREVRGGPALRGHGRGRTPSPARTSPAAPPTSRVPSASAMPRSRSRTPRTSRSSRTSPWTSAPAKPWPSWASRAAARAPCSSWSPASTTSPAVPSPSTGWTCASSRWRTCAPWSPWRLRTPRCSPAPSGTTSCSARPTPDRRRAATRPWRKPSTSPRPTSPTPCPDGVDTLIGEEGLSLSGGQRQRIALARAIAAKPAVLVLDDPLSALDVNTEVLVEARLRKVLADTTTLIVAHRPSTVALADRVALLEDGRIAAVGTHTELLARNSHYRYVIASLDPEPRDLDSELSALEDQSEEISR